MGFTMSYTGDLMFKEDLHHDGVPCKEVTAEWETAAIPSHSSFGFIST